MPLYSEIIDIVTTGDMPLFTARNSRSKMRSNFSPDFNTLPGGRRRFHALRMGYTVESYRRLAQKDSLEIEFRARN